MQRTWIPLAAIGLACGAQAQEPTISMRNGPLIGGQDRVLEIRTSCPNAPLWLLRGAYLQPALPAFGSDPVLSVAPAHPIQTVTDAQGRVRLRVPTQIGVYARGVSFFQAVVQTPSGLKVASDVQGLVREPLPAGAGHLVDDASARFPAGFDTLEASAVASADLDRDGWPDLVWANASGVRLWRNVAGVAFVDESAARLPAPSEPVATLELGDVDADGDLDLLTGGGTVWSVHSPDRLWRNDGSGVFTHYAGFSTALAPTTALELGDVDGDGDLDLVRCSGSGAHGQTGGLGVELLRQTNGQFVLDPALSAQPWNVGITSPNAARLFDADDDGDLDLFVAKSDLGGMVGAVGEANRLLINDGLGNFNDESAQRIVGWKIDDSFDAAAADIDGDGDLDLVVANRVGFGAANTGDLLINQGGAQGGTVGIFVDDATSPLEDSSPLSSIRLAVRAADVDSDGDLDLLVGVHDMFPTSQQMLLVNQGGAEGGVEGSFVRATWFDPGAFICSGMATLDADLDGDLELVMAAAGTLSGPPALGSAARCLVNTQL